MAFELFKPSTWDDPFRTGGAVREKAKEIIPHDIRYGITQGMGLKKAFAAENASQTQNKYNSPIYGGGNSPTGGGGSWGEGPTPGGNQGVIDTSIGNSGLTNLYGGGGGGGGAGLAAIERQMAELNRARESYLRRYSEQQKFRDTSKAYAEDQYGTAVQRGQETRGRLGEQYGKQRTEMGQDLGKAQQSLTGAYGSRGLGDSSFSEKAQAEAKITFDRNLSYLNESEADQYRDIDNYLTDLGKQRDYQLAELKLEDFNTAEDYNDAIAKFDIEKKNIQSQQTALRDSVAKASGQIGGMESTDALMKFYGELSSIMGTAMPEQQKKSILMERFAKAGKQDPERQYNYYDDWYKMNEQINANPGNEELRGSANSKFLIEYGVEPF